MTRFRFVSGLCVAGAMAVPSMAAAQSATSSKALAEALFQDGKALLEQGNLEAACPKLAESVKIESSLGGLLYLATCHEKQGKVASAWSEFTSAAGAAKRAGHADRLAYAEQHVAQLKGKLYMAVFVIEGAVPGFELKVDNDVLSAAGIGTAIPLDPGEHKLHASAPNYAPWDGVVRVPAGPGRTTVEVPPLKRLPPNPEQPHVALENSAPSRTGAWAVVGIGVAGLAVGGIFGVLTFTSRATAVQAGCPSCTTMSGLDAAKNATTYSIVSDVGFGVAGVAAIGAAWLFLTTKGSATPSATSAAVPSVIVTPTFGQRDYGIALQGHL